MKTCKNYRFDLESSDQILHELLSKHYITTDIAREVSEKFNARKVVLPKLIVMDVKNMLLTQNFRSFSIPHPESYQFLKSMHDQASIKGDDTRHGEMDLPSALTLMLNKNSRNGLHTLSATGFSIAHPRGWVSRLAEILPSLTSLTIPYCKLTTTDFTILCNEFQNLKTLDVSQTRLTNLSGIEKLQSLESLNLSGLFFDTEVDLECLFELMKLRVLFIRSTP
uniref:FTH domain-containing protein n=2 Tax=Caenorhabditis tropicalis TaxID=1561998 RepID=A0A1I7T494_9PELO